MSTTEVHLTGAVLEPYEAKITAILRLVGTLSP